ncbi:MAG TPA: tRNA (adenosine(37)-N6)-threonylcarbamoyltransferase complex transferase subunit TsaD [Myxococcota bacterium]|nr:tRNA (adenosine(37)-N6)-threonylcarbamoyltransferase complex transferase subunit TsaD [Myxococcota bacterium]HQK52364.1 tRNA (adenosine(37)-N6)-threonylcarbamoyltransferase complex transferase subunit TsaD [Myxococcota bacterium]
MRVLGIETSCDETAAAVVEDGRRVRSNVIHSQVAIHAPFRGVVPEVASRDHLRQIVPVVDRALREAGTPLDQVDGIAVTLGPGLIGSLLVGIQFAKGLALATGKPLVGIDHLEAHVMASFLVPDREPPAFPHLALAVSGGHTSLYRVAAPGRLERLGKTRDDAAGEAFDKAAAMLGLPYPGGVSIERAAEGHRTDAVTLPRPFLKEGLEMSFSGLKTALRRHLEMLRHPPDPQETGEIAAAFQEAVVDVLVTKTCRAAQETGVQEVVLAGGVSANRRLRERMAEALEREGRRIHLLPLSLCTDNAAMIAGLGTRYLFGDLAGAQAPRGLEMEPYTRAGGGTR